MTQSRARNKALHEAVVQADLTYDQLATRVRNVAAEAGETLRTNRSAVAHWVAGRPPAPATAGYVAEALSRALGRHVTPADFGWTGTGTTSDRADAELGLGIGPDPVDIVRRLGEADINRRKILTGAAYSVAAAALPLGHAQAAEAQQRAVPTSRQVGTSDIETVKAMLAAFAAIDERQGGQHGRSAVVQYLRSDVADLTRGRFATESLRSDAFSAAAGVSFLAGWKAYDAGEHGLAQRYQLQTLALAGEAGNQLQRAWVLRLMAHNGMDIRQPQHTLELADAAVSLAEERVSPGVMASFVICRARALAHAGRGREAAAEIRRAQDLALRHQEEPAPFWMVLNSHPTSQVNSHAAKSLRVLRDHANAERHYAKASQSYNSNSSGLNRIVALSLADQGKEQSAQGHLEQACGTWGRALDCFDGVFSDRAVKQVAGIRQQLAVFERRGVPAAAQLDERARAWQLAHA